MLDYISSDTNDQNTIIMHQSEKKQCQTAANVDILHTSAKQVRQKTVIANKSLRIERQSNGEAIVK